MQYENEYVCVVCDASKGRLFKSAYITNQEQQNHHLIKKTPAGATESLKELSYF